MGIKGDTPALKRAGEKLLKERLHELNNNKQLNLFPNELPHTIQIQPERPASSGEKN